MHVLERSVATAENGQKESRWNRAMVNRMKAPWKWMCVCFVFCSFWFILSLPYPQFLEQYLVDSLPSVNIFLMNVKGREIDVDIDDLFGGYLPIWEVVLLIKMVKINYLCNNNLVIARQCLPDTRYCLMLYIPYII